MDYIVRKGAKTWIWFSDTRFWEPDYRVQNGFPFTGSRTGPVGCKAGSYLQIPELGPVYRFPV